MRGAHQLRRHGEPAPPAWCAPRAGCGPRGRRTAHGACGFRARFSPPFSAARAPHVQPRRTPPRLGGALKRAPPRACADPGRAPAAAPLPPCRPLRNAAPADPSAPAPPAPQSWTRGPARGAW
jgi:hypothetical protein